MKHFYAAVHKVDWTDFSTPLQNLFPKRGATYTDVREITQRADRICCIWSGLTSIIMAAVRGVVAAKISNVFSGAVIFSSCFR